jgi:hypothetical protein
MVHYHTGPVCTRPDKSVPAHSIYSRRKY